MNQGRVIRILCNLFILAGFAGVGSLAFTTFVNADSSGIKMTPVLEHALLQQQLTYKKAQKADYLRWMERKRNSSVSKHPRRLASAKQGHAYYNFGDYNFCGKRHGGSLIGVHCSK